MLHEPAAPTGKDPASPYKTRLGLWMFLAYSVFYAGFVALNVASPKTLEVKVVFGLNLAVVYGMGLIVLALALAVVYNRLCEKKEAALAASQSTEQLAATADATEDRS